MPARGRAPADLHHPGRVPVVGPRRPSTRAHQRRADQHPDCLPILLAAGHRLRPADLPGARAGDPGGSPVLTYGAQASFIGELFDTRLRYTGSSVTYQIGGMLSSGPTPFIAAALVAWTGGTWAISLYLIAGALISIAAVTAARETYQQDTHIQRTAPVREAGIESTGASV